ncbi:2Fe-2S iron-sulfur cluster-binding protein [Williamsia serinedens]|uniref:3-ketosteroid 9alpha-monooxygenase subunit B n=1 Tax=Williamsia serinedens TaxID=391736 RepID=A0ABT1H0M4_9NOCA|nr:ferredoxin--NADP reductase [Williamsia serinedens]MCP2160083.1 3-ketosteroid 9alpha-monooxygenase subunit B [Williamsia serinedens]
MSVGPRGRAHELEVAEIIRETADSVSLVLDVPDSLAHRFRYHPGQFLTLRVPVEDTGSAVARCYSMSSSPHLDDDLILTVKRVPGGRASSWLCDEVQVGDRLTVLTPSGSFFPRAFDEDFLLVGAGSGITPLMSIATSALMGGVRAVRLFYANRDPASVIFVDEIAELQAEFDDRFSVEHWHESERGLPSPDAMEAELAAWSGHRVWVCGPGPFMAVVEKAAESVGIPADRVHTERYRSLSGDPFADVDVTVVNDDDDAQVTVTLRGDTVDLAWPRSATLLDVLLAAGHDAPFSCREGECSSCACRVLSGDVTMRKNDTLVDSDIAMGLTLACQAVPRSEEITVTFDS